MELGLAVACKISKLLPHATRSKQSKMPVTFRARHAYPDHDRIMVNSMYREISAVATAAPFELTIVVEMPA